MLASNKSFVYVMKLVGDKYYVGSAKKLTNFCETVTSGFTSLHKPISVVSTIKLENRTDVSYRTIYTLKYMQKYGIDNVRGGGYSEVNITQSSRDFIVHFLSHLPNLSHEDDNNMDVLELYIDGYKHAKLIQNKMYKSYRDLGLDYGELKRRINEYENNSEFLFLDTSSVLTRLKKQRIFGSIPFSK